VFWECLENTAGEVFPNATPQIAEPYWFYDSQRLKRVIFHTEGPHDDEWQDELFVAWQVFVRAYSRCGLSEERDKLVAINGVQQQLSGITGDTIIGGFWRKRLIQELCWIRHDMDDVVEVFRPRNWRAPTWIWASTNITTHPGNMRHHVDCSKLHIRVAIEALNIDAVASGQLKHASLTVRGKLLYGTYVHRGPPFSRKYAQELVSGNSSIIATANGSGDFNITFDNPDTPPHFKEELVFMGIYSCECRSHPELDADRGLEALALRPCEVGNSQYERVGFLTISDSGYDFYLENETNNEPSVIII
jgi:hypothetical protein